VPNDQVTIDPEFRPSGPDAGQAQRFRAVGVAAVVVVAFALGWFLRSPAPIEPGSDAGSNASGTTSTSAAVESTTTTTRPSTTTTTGEAPATFDRGVALSEAVPGFTDVITMEYWSQTGVDIARWRGPQSAPEIIASFRNDQNSWFGGLDASSAWYVLQDGNGVLSVHAVGSTGTAGWYPNLQAVGLRVASWAWHDTNAGHLAWLSCARTPDGPGTLFRLDVTEGADEPIAVRTVDRACAQEASVALAGWGDWGIRHLSLGEHRS